MKYTNIYPAVFIYRPNRFIAIVDIDGARCECHVKNTGRCRELLLPGTHIFVSKSSNPKRRTQYDLISVFKGERLINIDSQAPNKVVHEWLRTHTLLGETVKYIKPEYTFGKSRIDFYIETQSHKYLMEVKGVTLEKDNIAMFPDAPTERGVKHLQELIFARECGLKSIALFAIQLTGTKKFMPNWETHREFAEKLIEASSKGVDLIAMECEVQKNCLLLQKEIPIDLTVC